MFSRSNERGTPFFPSLLPIGAEAAVVGAVNEEDPEKKDNVSDSSIGSGSRKQGYSASASSSTRPEGSETEDRVSASSRELTEEQRQALEASKEAILKKRQALEIAGLEAYQKFQRLHPVSMVMFYASWCVWSRRAMPEYDAVALMMVHREPPLILAKVDAASEEDIASFENVTEFPLLKLYVEGHSRQYLGSVVRPPLIAWLNDKLDRDQLLESSALVDVFVRSGAHNLVIIAAFQPEAPKQTFVRLARTLANDVVFGHVESPALIDHLKQRHILRLLDEEGKRLQEQKEGLARVAAAAAAAALEGNVERQNKLDAQLRWEEEYLEEQQREQKDRRATVLQAIEQPPFILALSKMSIDPPVHVYDGNPSDLQKLEAFVLRYRFPVLTVLHPQRLPENFFQDRRPLALLILDTRADPTALRGIEQLQGASAADAGPPHPLVAALMKSGTKHRHALVCTVAGNTEPHERYFLDMLGVEDEHLPAIRAMTLLSEGDSRVHPESKFKPTPALMQRLGVSQPSPSADGEAAGISSQRSAAPGVPSSVPDDQNSGELAGVVTAEEEHFAGQGGRGNKNKWSRNDSAEKTIGGGDQHVVVTPDVISAFLDAFVARDVEPYYRSEALPDDEEEQRRPGTVRTLVGLNYQQLLLDTDDDVLVEFYAPWCGHCRKFEPVYKELAARLRDVKGIFLAKVDGNRNEIPGMRVSAYPTLILFPARTKKTLPSMQTARSYWYSGDKSMRDMLEWLANRTERARIHVGQLLAIDLAQRDAAGAVPGDDTVTKSVLEEL